MAKFDISQILEELKNEMVVSFDSAISKSKGEVGEDEMEEMDLEDEELPSLEDDEIDMEDEELPEFEGEEDFEMEEEELPVLKKKKKY